jgi:hypothetical protein
MKTLVTLLILSVLLMLGIPGSTNPLAQSSAAESVNAVEYEEGDDFFFPQITDFPVDNDDYSSTGNSMEFEDEWEEDWDEDWDTEWDEETDGEWIEESDVEWETIPNIEE